MWVGVDSRDSEWKQMEPHHIKTRTTARTRVVNWSYSVSHCLTPRARTIRRRPPNQRTDVSVLKLVKGLPWDRQGLVRRGRPPKVTLDAPTMAEAGEALRAGGSLSAGTRAPSIPPEPSTAKDGESDSWTQGEPETSIPSENARS